MSNRLPVYHEIKEDIRVISVANGMWVAQRRTSKDGTKTKDPWVNVCLPTTREAAIGKMNDVASQF